MTEETVFVWMDQEVLCNKVLVGTGIKLLNKVDPPDLEDSRNFSGSTSPIRYVMQNTKTVLMNSANGRNRCWLNMFWESWKLVLWVSGGKFTVLYTPHTQKKMRRRRKRASFNGCLDNRRMED